MKPVKKGKEDFMSAHDGGFASKLEKTSADNPERERPIEIIGRRARFSSNNEGFFLNSCFWDFPQEYNISNTSHQLGRENRGYFQRQSSP